jgi:branched-chain amino acid aminotransferase
LPQQDYSRGAAYVYGEYVPFEEATIPLWDMGFLHADVCYDVTSTWKGNFFRLDDHLKRFRATLEGFHMSLELDDAGLTEILMECIRRTGLRDTYVYFGATRGVPASGTYSRDPRKYVQQFIVFVTQYIYIIPEEVMDGRGAHLWISKKIRRTPPDSINPIFKNHAWPDLTNGLIEALEAGADQGALLDYDGNLTEGAGFNVFVIKDGEVATPDRGVLGGITRMSVLELCEEMGIPSAMRPVKGEELFQADEVFLSSTAGGIMPVSRVNEHIMSGDKPGLVSVQLKNRYWEKRESGWYATPVIYNK